MTYTEFLQACNERLIYKSVAVENERVREALQKRDDQEVLRLLDEEF
jgi:hypothetical protein